MPYTERFSEVHQVGAELYPDNLAAAVHQSAWFNMSIHHRAACVLMVGEMGQGATVDLILQEAQDAAGTGAAAIAGKAITQLTQAGGDGNDVCIIELRTEEMTPGFDFVRAVLTIGNAAVDASVITFGIINRFAPVATTLVTEVIG
jgi:hypothetical protein